MRQPAASDYQSLFDRVFSDARVSAYLFEGKVLEESEARATFRNEFIAFNSINTGLKIFSDKKTDEFLGFGGIIKARHSIDHYEFGYAFKRTAWGKGYATEIAQAQISWAFRNFEIDRLFALVHPENLGSIKVLNKLNLERVKTLELQEQVNRIVFEVKSKTSVVNF